jgi:hypothetical protein
VRSNGDSVTLTESQALLAGVAGGTPEEEDDISLQRAQLCNRMLVWVDTMEERWVGATATTATRWSIYDIGMVFFSAMRTKAFPATPRIAFPRLNYPIQWLVKPPFLDRKCVRTVNGRRG